MNKTPAPKADALPDCATPRAAESLRFPASDAQAGRSVRGNGRQNAAGTGGESPGIVPNRRSRTVPAGAGLTLNELDACPPHPGPGPKPRSARTRFEAMVIRRGPDDCWGWKGPKQPEGYGRLSVGQKSQGRKHVGAHRVSYVLHVGPIPAGIEVLHSCDNPECSNPRHLSLGTTADNHRDRNNKGRQAKGERHGMAVLNPTLVREIRRLGAMGGSSRTVARELGLNATTVYGVLAGRTWGHVQ